MVNNLLLEICFLSQPWLILIFNLLKWHFKLTSTVSVQDKNVYGHHLTLEAGVYI